MGMNIREIIDKDGFCVNHLIVDGDNALNYDVIFTAPFPCELVKITETHRVASTSGILQIEKLASGVGGGGGLNILVTAFDTSTTANTPQIKKGIDLVFSDKRRQLKVGERLSLLGGGTTTNLAGLQVTVYLTPLGKGHYS